MLVAQDDRRVYEARGNVGIQLVGMLLGGVLGIAGVMFVFVRALDESSRLKDIQPGIIGGLSVVPIILLARALFLLRGVKRVIIDKDGISLQGTISSKTIAWNQIERISKKDRSALMGENQDVLVLLGAKGKELAEIRDNLDRFPELIEQVTDRSAAARGAPTLDLAADEAAQAAKDRRKPRLMGILFGFFTLMMGAGFFLSLAQRSRDAKYVSEGMRVDAKIIHRDRQFVDYQFNDEHSKQHTGGALLKQKAFDDLLGARTLTVVYLRSDPSTNRPVAGVDDPGLGRLWWVMLGGAVLFGAMMVLSLLGFDVKTKSGSVEITRWGKPINDD
jgi:hypothetical protein